jgi:hypothetical protein
MTTAMQSHKQAKIINSMDLNGFKKYYKFLLDGGTVEGFIRGIETGVIKVKFDPKQEALFNIKSVNADIEKNNPNRDSKGRFTFGAGGPQGGGGAGGGAAVEGAEQAGAAEPYEETDDYRMRHQAPTRADEFGSPATNIGDEMMPGFYEKPQLYGSAYEQSDKESRSVLMSIRDKPNAPVTIYRAVPESVDKINPGDWVTLSPTYAKEHLRSNVSGGKILSQVIPAKDLWFDGNSINEFGYDPTD